ncbi:hypothetical protein [Laspinema palackyanum]|uniref:hypothetical protein n=1 Tax=Laspinema palackyanum TaxID=3231601 RepID=UPI00345D391E|nr:hypothetical protein [Laspinema sp. D2c]
MNSSSELKIYAPSLYWFCYHLHQGLVVEIEMDNQADSQVEPEPPIDLAWVETEYQRIFKAFNLKCPLDLVNPQSPQGYNLLKSHYPTKPAQKRKRQQNFTTSDGLKGFIYPQVINDTYALNLRIAFPEKYGEDEYLCKDLSRLNPENCFQGNRYSREEFLGQTLLLTIYLNQPCPVNPRDLDEPAKNCWLAFFKLKDEADFPRLYRVSPCCNGYLYEFGNPRETLAQNPYGHLVVWFMFDSSTTKILNKFYWSLPEFFLYRHKISKNFRKSRYFYYKADRIVQRNETSLNQLNQSYLKREEITLLTEEALQVFKNQLKTLLKLSLSYSQQLRNLEYAHNTIAINQKNYLAILDQMEQLAQMPLGGLRVFGEKEAVAFQDQITADLNYFRHGSGLLDTAIASIRGLVEIDQAERDRLLQDQNQTLQDNIQSIGVGIAVGAIIASTSGLVLQYQPMTFPWEDNYGDRLHPFVIAIAVSFAFSWIAWRGMKCLLTRKRRQDKKLT